MIKSIPCENGTVIKILHDDDPSSPREFENLGEILYTSTRCKLGDRFVTPDEIERIAKDKDNIVLDVYAYIHSGIVLSTSEFSCPWDSGRCGIIYVPKAKVREEWKVKRITKKLMDTVLSGLKSEIDTYSKYLGGEMYGYVVENEAGEHVDSCFGFYSIEEAEESAKECISHRKAS